MHPAYFLMWFLWARRGGVSKTSCVCVCGVWGQDISVWVWVGKTSCACVWAKHGVDTCVGKMCCLRTQVQVQQKLPLNQQTHCFCCGSWKLVAILQSKYTSKHPIEHEFTLQNINIPKYHNCHSFSYQHLLIAYKQAAAASKYSSLGFRQHTGMAHTRVFCTTLLVDISKDQGWQSLPDVQDFSFQFASHDQTMPFIQ